MRNPQQGPFERLEKCTFIIAILLIKSSVFFSKSPQPSKEKRAKQGKKIKNIAF
jgi:hypothetical protein